MKVLKGHFYGMRYEGNLSVSFSGLSVSGSLSYSDHRNELGYKTGGYSIGIGTAVGVDAIPFMISGNINRGASTEWIHQLGDEVRKSFREW